ncbi:MAG: hypothetical protein CM15mP125_0960 [Gammaproteobacteria bacterium]|nr:MAG: hypothetical protein CM15mP125_0960 [Gammaproteobacteria bacterium]
MHFPKKLIMKKGGNGLKRFCPGSSPPGFPFNSDKRIPCKHFPGEKHHQSRMPQNFPEAALFGNLWDLAVTSLKTNTPVPVNARQLGGMRPPFPKLNFPYPQIVPQRGGSRGAGPVLGF